MSDEESETEILINEVQARPFLYNRRDAKYKKVYLKKQAWEHIASKIKSFDDPSAAERRWNSLRGKYSTELLRYMNNDADRINKWKYFDSLAFLKDHVNPRSNNNQSYQNPPNFRSHVDNSNSWSPEFANSNNVLENNNPEQYYNNLLNLLNDDSIDHLNGNDNASPPEKIVKLESVSPSKPTKVNAAPLIKKTSSHIFGEYVGQFLEELGDDSMEVQLKIMQLLADSKKKKTEAVTTDEQLQ